MKTLSHPLHARVDAVLGKTAQPTAPVDADLARRCLRAERVTLIALVLAIAVLFALSGEWVVAPHAAFVPADMAPSSAQFGWPI